MQESLYDRFRPFKPFDLALGLVLVVLLATSTGTGPANQAIMAGIGVAIFFVLDFLQRFIRLPAPQWQASGIVLVNSAALTVLIYLPGQPHFLLTFYILNVCFATVAFGRQMGIAAAGFSIAGMIAADLYTGYSRHITETALLAGILANLVAILLRVNRLQHDALIDAVTGLRNHRYFQDRLREELHRSERFNRPTSLVMVDLDDFKKINDRFGHATGDILLYRIAQILVRNARAADIVCRYGGEEMVVILPETDAASAEAVAERLRESVAEQANQPGPYVTISLGVAGHPEHADDADGLIVAADEAMYSAKRAGKNRVAAPPRVAQLTGLPFP